MLPAKESEAPQYEHDCSQCRFERRGVAEGKQVDVYTCPAELMGPSMIIRFAEEEDEYWSMPVASIDRVSDFDSQTDYMLLARQVLAERASFKWHRDARQKAHQLSQHKQEQAKLIAEFKANTKEEETDGDTATD